MRIDMLLVGLILFSLGIVSLLAFTMLSNYIITLYPISGYLGLGMIVISFPLLYKGIFSIPPYRYEIVSPSSDLREDPQDLETFEEWEGEETVFYP
ncbi:MAG TPA: hypothetical protein ENI14_01825 [Thermoplasmatales archaeon]|nr:hypothetical protein [Thermoplasmatales archaeon]